MALYKTNAKLVDDRRMFITLLIAGLVAVVRWTEAREFVPSDFDWYSLTPTFDLEWNPCYEELQCARLIAPLDWLDYDDARQANSTVTLAIIQRPAVVSPESRKYGGTIFTNPGGPGDSGIVSILKNGKYIQNMMDSNKSHFDILSFDPRGMGFTTPSADCYANEAARAIAHAYEDGLGLPDRFSNASLAKHIAVEKALSLQCLEHSKRLHGFAIQEHMSTASVARDMLYMVDKIEERKLHDHLERGQELQQHVTDRKASRGLAKIRYYGTSYGTLLGQTFLSMFPGRVHRIILDGTVVADEYIAGNWCPWLEDTTHALDYFYKTCAAAGNKCPLKQPSDTFWQSVKKRIEDLITDLDEQPEAIPVVEAMPYVVSGQTILQIMWDPSYAPLVFFESLAETLAAALKGNFTGVLNSVGATRLPDTCQSTSKAGYAWMDLANKAVSCGDSRDRSRLSYADWQKHFDFCEKKSPEIGLSWGSGCMGWSVRPRFRFEGPFASHKADPTGSREDAPSAPPLFLSTRTDPVTPLRNARVAMKDYHGAGLVVQNSSGHCAMLSSPSQCTFEYVREYMKSGIVPRGEVECEADCVPFKPCPYPVARLPR